MTDHTEELRAIQARLVLIAGDYKATSPNEGERSAIMRAVNWLGDITEPLTEEESERWSEHANSLCDELADDMSGIDYNDFLTDADRRALIDDEGM